MKKPFLLTAGDNYYPCSGDSNWIACFATLAEAELAVKDRGNKYDWYEIIDLNKWVN